MCSHQDTNCTTLVKGKQEERVLSQQLTGQVGLVPGPDYDVIFNKTSFTSKILCSYIIDQTKTVTIIAK